MERGAELVDAGRSFGRTLQKSRKRQRLGAAAALGIWRNLKADIGIGRQMRTCILGLLIPIGFGSLCVLTAWRRSFNTDRNG